MLRFTLIALRQLVSLIRQDGYLVRDQCWARDPVELNHSRMPRVRDLGHCARPLQVLHLA